MSEPYRIRPARRGDREGIANLLAEIGYPQACDNAILAWVISHPEMEAHMAVDPLDRVIGMVSFSHRPQLRLKGRVATIDELVVTQAWRGKGIGRALMQRAITRLKVLSCKRLELASIGRQSIPFFQKLGLTEVDGGLMRLAELETEQGR